jgi:SNF2 family DNA or RNA helicase
MNEANFQRKPRDKLALLGHECMWYRIVIDEAHMIKNRNSIQSKASVDLQAKHRLCLTGTPMMNSIDELYPLLRFLRVSRYNDWKLFSHEIGKVSEVTPAPHSTTNRPETDTCKQPAKDKHPDTRKKAMNRVQIVLKAVMLRRQKTSEVDGKPILNLPPKHIEMDNVDFSDDEFALYKALETKSQIQFNKYLKNNTMSCE